LQEGRLKINVEASFSQSFGAATVEILVLDGHVLDVVAEGSSDGAKGGQKAKTKQ
jgi:hypothetical protein